MIKKTYFDTVTGAFLEYRECWFCEDETEHVYMGRFTQPIKADVWTCIKCDTEEHDDY